MPTDKAKLVRYIGDMSREMAKMADTSSYLLHLVAAEAQMLSASDPTAAPDDPLHN